MDYCLGKSPPEGFIPREQSSRGIHPWGKVLLRDSSLENNHREEFLSMDESLGDVSPGNNPSEGFIPSDYYLDER